MPNVLLIDDDTEFTALLGEYLRDEGFQVDSSVDARAGLSAAEDGHVDIIVLDVMMPHVNGIDALQRIRRRSEIPVIMLTAKGDDVDCIAGLNLGADDYIAKPCMPGELVARIRAVLRRTGAKPAGDADGLGAGALLLYPGTRTAQWQGQPLELTGTEFSILEILARNGGQLVAKQDISRRVFGRNLAPFDRRIDVHISSIRQKLGNRPDGTTWIKSVRGQGYQLLQET